MSHKKSSLFNWLKHSDANARKLPRATDWFQYPLFMFARYRRLQPKPNSKDALHNHQVKSGYETFSRFLTAWEDRIQANQETQRVLQGLSQAQRKQLAALVADTRIDLEEYVGRKEKERRFARLASEGPRRQRMLSRKSAKARRAVEEWRDYAKRLGAPIGSDHAWSADRCLQILDRPGPIRSFPALRRISEDPTASAMVRLYWFFRHSCGVSGDEAEVRVALIRNAFWIDFEVPAVSYLPAYQTGESKGCPAVRQAVRRRKPEAGTSR